jgi:hypothetical protein
VRTFDEDAHHNLVLFGHDVLDRDLNVGKATAKIANERLQLRWTMNFRLAVAQTVFAGYRNGVGTILSP